MFNHSYLIPNVLLHRSLNILFTFNVQVLEQYTINTAISDSVYNIIPKQNVLLEYIKYVTTFRKYVIEVLLST